MYCKNVGKSEAERRSACADGCGLNDEIRRLRLSGGTKL